MARSLLTLTLAFALAATASGALGACGGTRAPRLPSIELVGSDGAPHRLADLPGRAKLTVVTFFSADCPCQRIHDERLRALAEAYARRGVQVVAIDSEASASPQADAAEAKKRGYPYPVLSDPEGAAADALGAEFATYSVILDAAGRVRWAGGIDSDRHALDPDAVPYLRDALDRLLAEKEPAAAPGPALGCALRRK